MTLSPTLIKESGATFTPKGLADYVSDKLLKYFDPKNQVINVLDPACGDGILLNSLSNKLLSKKIDFKLVGYDLNGEFITNAEKNLSEKLKPAQYNLYQSDFLEEVKPELKQQSLLFDYNDSSIKINNTIDLVIANPPYVRTQILGSKYAQKIAKKFGLTGRVDLYFPFLLGMTYALKDDGLIGVITSNRYLTTQSGISVRKFIEDNYKILEIIDLGDTKLFDAAVLPAIFIGQKKRRKDNSGSKFIKIYEELNGVAACHTGAGSIFEVLNSPNDGIFQIQGKKFRKTSGLINFSGTKDSSWTLLSKKEDEWIKKINLSSKNTIGDFFKVRVGIKTTADKIFIRNDWESQIDKPESELIKDLISQENIEPWHTNYDKMLQVLYPHYSVNGKKETIAIEDFPKAKKYLESYKDKLSSRKYLIDAGRKWYEIWVPQNPSFWEKPKLVFPDISAKPRFYFDDSGKVVNGNCYWIVAMTPSDVKKLLLMQGVANSKLMTKYHDLMFNNKLYSGRRRYFSQYVEKYPLPNVGNKYSKEIISIVSSLNSGKNGNKDGLINELEIAVASAFGVEPVLV